MLRKSVVLRILTLLGDIAILAGSVSIAYLIRFHWEVLPERPIQPFELYQRFSILVSVIGVILLSMGDHYHPKGRLFSLEIVFSLLRDSAFIFLIALVISFLMREVFSTNEAETQSRIVLVLGWGICIFLLTTWRGILHLMLWRFRQQGSGLNQVLIVGANQVGKRFFDALKAQPSLGYNPIGFLDDGCPTVLGINDGLVLGEMADFEKVIQERWVDQLVLAGRHLQQKTVGQLKSICEKADISFTMIPDFLEIVTSKSQIYDIAGIPVVTVGDPGFQRLNRFLKRSLDFFLLFFLFAITAPLLIPLVIVVSFVIKISSPGPVLFRQRRVGKGGRPFYLLKFRSMCQGAESMKGNLKDLNEAQGALFKIRNDPRVTRVGRIIRRYSIDELPQLINVFKGEMSLVGPRPPLPDEVHMYEVWQMKRIGSLPGMVGLPQVSGRSDLTFDEVVRLDLFYIENWSLLLDLKILLKAIPVVFLGRGAY
jgi:exopolysaccharide biosynthesis polyprenyl glycosylphosphotransferase